MQLDLLINRCMPHGKFKKQLTNNTG